MISQVASASILLVWSYAWQQHFSSELYLTFEYPRATACQMQTWSRVSPSYLCPKVTGVWLRSRSVMHPSRVEELLIAVRLQDHGFAGASYEVSRSQDGMLFRRITLYVGLAVQDIAIYCGTVAKLISCRS